MAIPINLTKILEVRGLVGRAGEAIVPLVAVLVVSTLVLVPDQPRVVLGTKLLVAGLLAWSILWCARCHDRWNGQPSGPRGVQFGSTNR